MRVVQVFMNADLRNGHEGLAKMAKEFKIDVEKLNPGEFVIFINAHKDRLKLYAANHVIAYLKAPKGGRLDLRTIQLIPETFMAKGKIDYDADLKRVLLEFLARRGHAGVEVGKKES